MLRYNRNRARGRFFPLFSPRELFYGSVPGAWYDPTDLSTMFQDSTGTTPVTAVEQPVGRILDKSGNGNHASQSTAASRPTYRARYNLLTFSEQMDNGAWTKSSAGTGSAPVVTPNAAVAPDGTLTADSVLFNRGAGNAIGDQSLLSQTPTVVSGTYTQSVWLKAAAPADVGKQLAMRNVAGSSYLVVTLTADWVRYTRTETGSLSVWDLTNRGTITTGNSVTALVWGAQLLTAADVTATGNAYQRIAAATVYDTAPIFRPYLAFDGVDDSLSTAAINFTSTDKMTVFAGASKLSDAASGNLVELSVNKNLNAGTFYMWFPELSPTGDIVWVTRGTVNTSPFARVAIAAPVTAVVTGTGDIPGDTATIRINNLSNTTTADQGAGAFGTYPLYIGRRGGVSQPFNGRLFSLIVRGAASSTTEIIDTETWVNARTGAF